MKEVRTFGYIENGELKIHRRKEFLEGIEIMGGKKIVRGELVFKKLFSKRSNKQNAYHWAYLMAEFVRGYKESTGVVIKDEKAHEMMRIKFLTVTETIINIKTGEVSHIDYVRSSTELTTVEFMEWEDEIGKFITEWFGYEILKPGEQAEVMFPDEKK